jgi:hypothetical protein
LKATRRFANAGLIFTTTTLKVGYVKDVTDNFFTTNEMKIDKTTGKIYRLKEQRHETQKRD